MGIIGATQFLNVCSLSHHLSQGEVREDSDFFTDALEPKVPGGIGIRSITGRILGGLPYRMELFARVQTISGESAAQYFARGIHSKLKDSG